MGSKKITKTLAKFDLGHQLAKKLGLPDPSGDLIYGSNKALTPAEQAQKNAMNMAKQQAAQQEQQMQLQMQAANLAAQNSAAAVANSQERERLTESLKDAGKVTDVTPTVELQADAAGITQPARRKFRSQIGGASGAPSIRV